MVLSTRLGRDALPRCCIAMRYRDTVWRFAIVVHNHDVVLQCFIAMPYPDKMLIAMRLLMLYLGTFSDALSRCIIAGRYHIAAVKFFIAILSRVTFVMYYRGAFRDVFLMWGFGSKTLCCNIFSCYAVYRDI